MRVLICGDRRWKNDHLIHALLTGLFIESTVGYGVTDFTTFTLIEGCAPGADAAACWWGKNSPFHGPTGEAGPGFEGEAPVFEHLHYPAQWDTYGKSAGPIRNRVMLNEGRPEIVYAFHNDLQNSRGTKDMVTIAQKAGIPVYLITGSR